MRSMVHPPKVGVSLAVACAAILLGAAVVVLALGSHRFEGKAWQQRNATAARGTGGAMADKTERAEPVVRARAVASYGRLPLSFEANQGQTDRQVKFLARGSGYSLFLTGNEAVLSLKKSGPRSQESGPAFRAARLGPAAFRQRQGSADLFSKSAPFPAALLPTADQFKDSFVPSDEARIPDPESQAPAVLRMKLVGANPHAKVSGLEELPGKSNYFIGNDPKKWRTNVPNYAKAKYANVYPGVDLVYYGNQGQLEYDFVLQPGADPRAIHLGFAGATFPRIDGNGDLVLGTGGGEVIFHKPVVYQPANDEPGTRDVLEGNYVIRDHEQVTFEVANYDRARSLVIDPTLAYSTYLGGSAPDNGSGIAVDASGNAYVTGQTFSSDFPTTAGAFQTKYGGGGSGCCGHGDAFVTKLNAAGSALVYSTYLGGSGNDGAFAIAIDASGNAYVTGTTASPNFPVTTGAFQTTYGGKSDAFVTKLNAAGSSLLYSTYLGGSGPDGSGLSGPSGGIAVDASGNAYVTGGTGSTNFPTTPGAFQTSLAGSLDVFVSKLNAAGSALLYSTYLGGTNGDSASAIVVDPTGEAYVTGGTFSDDFPTTPGAFEPSGTGTYFVSKVNADGSALVYSTYLQGGSNLFGESRIAVDASGNAYLTGITDSGFPTTPGSFQPICGPFVADDVFITKLNAGGSALVYSTCLGGSNGESGGGIAVDASGNAYVTGETFSSDFPITPGAFQTTAGGGGDAFFSKLNAAGSALLYSTYLGGNGADAGFGIGLDASGNAYVTGSTGSSNFRTTSGAFQTTFGGGLYDAFISKFSFGTTDTTPPVTIATLSGPKGDHGWYRGPVTVTLTATDPDDPVAATYYTVDGGPKQTYSAPFSITSDGVHQLSFYSVDLAGNQEKPHQLKIKIDATPPTVTVAVNPATLWPPNGDMVSVSVSGAITDAASGVDPSSVTFRVTDDYGSIQPSGPVTLGAGGSYSFAVSLRASRRGTDLDGRLYTVTVSAEDNAGNAASASTTVIVPHDQRK